MSVHTFDDHAQNPRLCLLGNQGTTVTVLIMIKTDHRIPCPKSRQCTSSWVPGCWEGCTMTHCRGPMQHRKHPETRFPKRAVLRSVAMTPRPEYILDWLSCSRFARQRGVGDLYIKRLMTATSSIHCALLSIPEGFGVEDLGFRVQGLGFRV